MLDRFGEPPGVGSNAHPMQMSELIDYLKKIDNFSLSPWVAVVGQTEAMGDPATPTREQVAILRWLGKALEIWEKQFPLEARIAAQVRRLKPLSAAFAVMDPWFLQPGAHPLHQLLDVIQARAIGWQARLDRVGAVLEQQVTKAVDDSREWFENGSVDLTGICAEFSAAAERDQARAQRMVQRVIETEAGKVKTATAKQEAARMINTLLAQYPATEEIGNFIKGHWYTSAQLLLLKYGAESEEWSSMCTTTATLLDSLQSIEDADESRRQRLFEVVTQLPKDMRRWLFSLHHDTEAVNEAMGLVEFTHLKILRRQELDRKVIEPIVVEGEHVSSGDSPTHGALKNWQEGQWFSVNTTADGTVRMQLVLKVESSQQLVFTNLAGLKVLQLSFAEFNQLAEQKKVQPLYSGASFSLCLAQAVGIDSVEIMNALVNALGEHGAVAEDTAQAATPPRGQHVPQAQPQLTQETQSEPTPDEELELQAELHDTSYIEPAVDEGLLAAGDDAAAEPSYADILDSALEPGMPKYEATELAIPGRALPPRAATPAESLSQGSDHRQQPAPAERGTADERLQRRRISDEYISKPSEQLAAPTADPGTQADRDDRQISLPMGAWLGFHDGDVPLLAKLAVHDTEDDYFIFVNRKGVKMRKISRLELLRLIDEGMVDLLQTTSNFRSAVSEIRKNLDQ